VTTIPDLEADLAVMAKTLIDTATDDTRVDVFKAVSTWHIAMRKVTKGDGEDSGQFEALRRTINGAHVQ
jgi:hypothetical protein